MVFIHTIVTNIHSFKGSFDWITDNRKTYIEGETVVYLAYSLHEPSCEVDSEYYVVFKK
jgi:hypothetical protein